MAFNSFFSLHHRHCCVDKMFGTDSKQAIQSALQILEELYARGKFDLEESVVFCGSLNIEKELDIHVQSFILAAVGTIDGFFPRVLICLNFCLD